MTTPTPAAAAIEIRVDHASRVPGLRFRLFRDDDYAQLAEVMADAHVADHVEWIPDEASLRADLENRPEFDPRRHIVVADVEGRIVAFGEHYREPRDDTTVYMAGGKVQPEFRRRGIGRALFRYNMARLRELAMRHDDNRRRELAAWIAEGEMGGRILLESEGFVPVRFGFGMRRRTLDGLPDIELPRGLALRAVDKSHYRRIFDADNEAFRDHWGHREQSDEDFRALFAQPDLDTRLWRVAWDGDEVAGSVITFIFRSENARLGVKRGWLERVSVRRPWRRRGLARALIVSALRGLREAGMAEAMLGVDTQNPTGALQLYESLGFSVHDRSTSYRKAW
jgi:mycothiol synthase